MHTSGAASALCRTPADSRQAARRPPLRGGHGQGGGLAGLARTVDAASALGTGLGDGLAVSERSSSAACSQFLPQDAVAHAGTISTFMHGEVMECACGANAGGVRATDADAGGGPERGRAEGGGGQQQAPAAAGTMAGTFGGAPSGSQRPSSGRRPARTRGRRGKRLVWTIAVRGSHLAIAGRAADVGRALASTWPTL